MIDTAPLQQTDKFFPYQLDGALFLAEHNFALLADEQGLGKSAQAILASHFIEAKSVLVVCPASLVENWKREFKKFHPQLNGVELVVRSFDSFLNEKNRIIEGYDLLIVDECHYLKSPDAKRTINIVGRNGVVRLAKKAVWFLSGTPCPNHAGELWVMLHVFGVTQLNYSDFLNEYCITLEQSYGQNYFDKKLVVKGTRLDKVESFREMIKPIFLRRVKKEVGIELPELFITPLTLSPQKITLTPTMSIELKKDLDKIKNLNFDGDFDFDHSTMSDELLVKLLEGLAPSIATLRKYNGMQKAIPLASLVDCELLEGAYEKVVIFAYHSEVIASIYGYLTHNFTKTNRVALVVGSTPQDKRQAEVDRFQKKKECEIFLANIEAAGVGLTLTAAHHCYIVEPSWTVGTNAQAAARCHRIGQENNVTVRMVALSNNGFDEKITRVLARKAHEIAALLSSDETQ